MQFTNIHTITVILIVIIMEIILAEGNFQCFRKQRKGRRKEFCKGPMKNKRKYGSPEKCCAKRGQGFATRLKRIGKNRYKCTPCTLLLTTTTPVTTPMPDWGEWGSCSTSCGAGWRSRYRMCSNCDKNHFDNAHSEPCMINFYCPVDGNWGPWFGWTSCSESCGGGVREREKTCNYPPPSHGGRDCPGEPREEQDCNEDPCPIDGGWGAWSHYSLCSVTCGSGAMTRTRQCDNPTPQHGGKNCPGSGRDSRRCTSRQCPQHGGWSLWGSWNKCPVTCGVGQRTRTRECNSPRPLFGGRRCDGRAEEVLRCDAGRPCPRNGGWSSWTDFGRCRAARCQEGIQIRSRSCTSPRPKHGGRPCVGRHKEEQRCVNTINCPIQGNWCDWLEWSSCTATCTGLSSMQVRQRKCECPVPNTEGQGCSGESFEVRECVNVPPCRGLSEFFPAGDGGLTGNDGGDLFKVAGSGDGSKTNGDQEDDPEKTVITGL
ncbi:coadhesin-like [Mizuhopecten yessoensis]|uniref:Hemicentin-1 n=1 Tax=Mizuhopecten yessoensis TaxID=6573 RepID=A0A210PS52_MIZYE|nr:coadhesin-like [Mizuhopecten yessoensis]OWF39337.1 Hemicentin-1 [Mizuhopecten yessoensis]